MNYFDTSVLVAAVRSYEPGHAESLRAMEKGGVTSSHAMLEAFAILTGGQSHPRLTPSLAAKVLAGSCEQRFKPVALTWKEIHAMLAETQARGIRGGAIYDYQHLVCARKAGASSLLTLNVRDFLSFAREGDPKIERPS